MAIRTADNVKKNPSTRPSATSASGGGGGGRRSGGNDGGGIHPFGIMDKSNERVKLVTWFILLAVMMTFVGLIGAYVVVSTNGVIEWNPFRLPFQIWVSTGLLILSSVAIAGSHRARVRGRQSQARTWLIATTVLGATFIASQVLTWMSLFNAGYYMRSNPYAGFFYFITALHAVHVGGGICALGYAVLRTWTPSDSQEELERRLVVSRSVGQYWHFMDALWIVLVLMFALWK